MKKNKQNAISKESKKVAQKEIKKNVAEELKLAVGKFVHTSKKADKIIEKTVAQLVKKLAKEFKIAEQVEEVAPNSVIKEDSITEIPIPIAKKRSKKTAKVTS